MGITLRIHVREEVPAEEDFLDEQITYQEQRIIRMYQRELKRTPRVTIRPYRDGVAIGNEPVEERQQALEPQVVAEPKRRRWHLGLRGA